MLAGEETVCLKPFQIYQTACNGSLEVLGAGFMFCSQLCFSVKLSLVKQPLQESQITGEVVVLDK